MEGDTRSMFNSRCQHGVGSQVLLQSGGLEGEWIPPGSTTPQTCVGNVPSKKEKNGVVVNWCRRFEVQMVSEDPPNVGGQKSFGVGGRGSPVNPTHHPDKVERPR